MNNLMITETSNLGLFTFDEYNADILKYRCRSRCTSFRTLKKLRDDNKISKISKGIYSFETNRIMYRFESSPRLKEISESIQNKYPLISFQIWEMYQLNEFVNHLIAHNAYFVEVEKDCAETVFEFLRENYRDVLLNPSENNFYHYRCDDMIIVEKLISGSPAPINQENLASLEKLLVDLFSKKLTGKLIERAEYPKIYEDAFEMYAINEGKLFRYAGRRNLDNTIRKFIKEQTGIRLRLEGYHDRKEDL